MFLKKMMEKITEASAKTLVKVLLAVFFMLLSIFVLAYEVPKTKLVQETVESLEESRNQIMDFSGATITTSLAITALPDDFGTPLADTLADMNTYFVFVFAVVFVEKLLVVEGIRIAFTYVIPAALGLYILGLLATKDRVKVFGEKLFIFGMAVVLVIPISTHFTEKVCADYLVYVDETIAEANDGAEKVNEIMSTNPDEATIFDKLSNAFKTAMKEMSDLLDYFENVLKKFVNSIAIMIVTTFVLPLFVLMVFKWLLNELFTLNLFIPQVKVMLPGMQKVEKAEGSALSEKLKVKKPVAPALTQEYEEEKEEIPALSEEYAEEEEETPALTVEYAEEETETTALSEKEEA
ncbi:MAG: hypothetical protein IKK33_10815 [Lachnospiraceae bacterium]|nr:hypothetical protein [Lachnospiraceae bacterium]